MNCERKSGQTYLFALENFTDEKITFDTFVIRELRTWVGRTSNRINHGRGILLQRRHSTPRWNRFSTAARTMETERHYRRDTRSDECQIRILRKTKVTNDIFTDNLSSDSYLSQIRSMKIIIIVVGEADHTYGFANFWKKHLILVHLSIDS